MRMEKTRFLGLFGIIQAAIKIPFMNPSFIAYTCITSLPLFCLKILPEFPFLPNIIKRVILLLDQPHSPSKNRVIYGPSINLTDLAMFIAAVTVIEAASTIYKDKAGKSTMSVRDLLRNSSIRTRLRSPLFVYIVMSWLSSLTLDAVSLYGKAGPSSSMRNNWSPPMHFFSLLVAAFLRDEFSAWWQVALVSVLEEDKVQYDAFLWSWKVRKGNRFKGFASMVLYFGWRFLHLGSESGIGYVVVDRGLFCLGMIMNWVACTVYYHDCKNRIREEEISAVCHLQEKTM